MTGRRLTVRTAARAAAVLVAAVVTLATTFVVSGPFGLVIAADCLAALGLIIALVSTPRSDRERPAHRPEGIRALLLRARFWSRRDRHPVVPAADFPAYAKISSDLGWAPVSEWHYDHGARPLLARLMQSALTEHHRVDAVANPAQARRLVGDDVWPYLDPARPASFDSKTPGTDLRTLTRIVDRLEQL